MRQDRRRNATDRRVGLSVESALFAISRVIKPVSADGAYPTDKLAMLGNIFIGETQASANAAMHVADLNPRYAILDESHIYHL